MANRYVISGDKLTDLADAIREKSGTSELMDISEMTEAVRTGGGSVQVDLLFEGERSTTRWGDPIVFDDINPYDYDYLVFYYNWDAADLIFKGRFMLNVEDFKLLNSIQQTLCINPYSGNTSARLCFWDSAATFEEGWANPLTVYTSTGYDTTIYKIVGIKGDLGGI